MRINVRPRMWLPGASPGSGGRRAARSELGFPHVVFTGALGRTLAQLCTACTSACLFSANPL